MILNILLIVLIIISLGVIGFIIFKKLPQLKMVEPDEVVDYREKRIKNKILEKKIQRDFNSFLLRVKKIFGPVVNFIFSLMKKGYANLYKIEERYRAKLVKTHFDDKISKESETLQHIEKAKGFLEEKAFDKAEVEYIEALKLDVHNLDIYKQLADLYFQIKDYDKAKETYEYIIKVKEDDYVYSKLGDISKNKGDLNQAVNNYSKSVSIDSNNPMHYYNLAKINLKMELIEDAKKNIDKALNIEPENPKFLDFLLDLSIIMKDKDLANKTLLKLKEVNPDNNKILEVKERIDNI